MSLSDLTPGVQSIYSRGLCPGCHWSRLVISGRGSQFLLCNKTFQDSRFPKYPPQPIAMCSGYLAQSEGGNSGDAPPERPDPGAGDSR
ncbi:MAG: hypothetical protein ACKO3P_07155 [Planctomycetaceae bacterium]